METFPTPPLPSSLGITTVSLTSPVSWNTIYNILVVIKYCKTQSTLVKVKGQLYEIEIYITHYKILCVCDVAVADTDTLYSTGTNTSSASVPG